MLSVCKTLLWTSISTDSPLLLDIPWGYPSGGEAPPSLHHRMSVWKKNNNKKMRLLRPGRYFAISRGITQHLSAPESCQQIHVNTALLRDSLKAFGMDIKFAQAIQGIGKSGTPRSIAFLSFSPRQRGGEMTFQKDCVEEMPYPFSKEEFPSCCVQTMPSTRRWELLPTATVMQSVIMSGECEIWSFLPPPGNLWY